MTSDPLSYEKICSLPKFLEMIRMVDEQPIYYKKGLGLGQKIKKDELADPRTVFFYGIGGSGIVGLLFSGIFSSITRVPILASNAVRIPEWLSQDDLLIVVSYSGETYEALRAFNEAIKRKIRLLGMTSGGTLAEIARRNNIQLIELSKGFPPRMSLPEMLGAAASTLDNIDITKNAGKTLQQAAEMLTEIAKENGPANPYEDNIAKKAALHFYNGLPGIFCSGHLYFTGLRLKNQLNENAKFPCVVHEVPESMHNTLEALPYSDKDKYLLLRSSNETDDISAQMRFISSTFSHRAMEVWFKGNIVYESIASIMWVDYVSIYLAALREVDPITVARIAMLRKEVERILKK